jgi:hypothetical protein
VQSLSTAKVSLALLNQEGAIQNELLGAYMALYDCLNDDDEEIRETAAQVVFYIVLEDGKHSFAEVPLAAAATLMSWLLSRALSSELCKHAIARMTEASPDIFVEAIAEPPNKLGTDSSVFRSPPEILAEAMSEDYALFVEEKQNLYISPVREAQTWSKITLLMDPNQIPLFLLNAFSDWVTYGIRLLIEAAEERMDGPLGWTTIPDVFTFGVRVIHSAEVLLSWSRMGKVTIEKSRLHHDLLVRLMEKSHEGRAHEIWGSKISSLLDIRQEEPSFEL